MPARFSKQLVTHGETEQKWLKNVQYATVYNVKIMDGVQVGTVRGFGRVQARRLGRGKVWVRL